MILLKKAFLVISLLVLCLYLINYFSGIYLADRAFDDSQTALSAGEYAEAMVLADRAIEKNPLEPNYYRGRAKIYLGYLSEIENRESQVILKKAALEDMKNAYDLNPKNLVTIRNLIPLYYFLASKDLTQPAGKDNIDDEFLAETISFYKRIENISPNDVGVYALLAKYEKRLGLTKEYGDSVKKVNELRPDLLDWYEAFK